MTTRIYHPAPLKDGTEIMLSDEAGKHLSRVLRVKVQDSLIVFDGNGAEHDASIVAITRHRVTAWVSGTREPGTDSALNLTLYQALSTGRRMDLVMQKATELGVRRICPVITERCVTKLTGDRITGKLDHWRKVTISASEQCGRTRIPEISAPVSLDDACQQVGAETLGLALDPLAMQSIPTAIEPDRPIILLVGPEGGLTADEFEMASHHGFQRVQIGPRTLRTETAPIAAIAVIQYVAGDLSKR
jgi:16S rRNA (uracil1498-N3)-methyltransferase